jgi:hypothetical protein
MISAVVHNKTCRLTRQLDLAKQLNSREEGQPPLLFCALKITGFLPKETILSTTYLLTGLYRLRNVAPGFAICLFSADSDNSVYVQTAGKDNQITGLLPANIEGSIIFDAPLQPDGTEWSVCVGQIMLYAFHRPDGSFAIGPREEVEATVREDISSLRSLPFLWEEAANFIGDEEQQGLARMETAKLLCRTPVEG